MTTDAAAWLRGLVDHEISSVGISAGNIAGLSLEPVARVLDGLGRPDTTYRTVHVTGTNGKGSVCRMAEALVAATGLRVGTYVSPEGTPNERIRIDGRPIADDALADAAASVRGVAELVDVTLTAFEAVTLTALVAFADAPVDVAIIEVGLLGRYDATNVIDGDVAVVTTIGGDHTDFAPGWRDRVASEKAGILKPTSQAVLGDVGDDVLSHFTAEGAASLVQLGVDFEVLDDRVALGGRQVEVSTSRGSRFDVFVPLHGAHQSHNVAVAIEATESVLETQLGPDVVEAAFGDLALPGRVEVVATAPLVVVDGAHNADAATVLGEALTDSFVVAGRRVAVVGVLKGRDPVAFLEALNAGFPLDLVVAASLPGPRGEPAPVVAAAAESLGIPKVTSGEIAAAMAWALDQADEDDLIVATGSFRVVGDATRAARRR